jgi:protein gp37
MQTHEERETMSTTGISWTDKTWNPWAGCAHWSPGCTNCYAMREAYRISKHPTAAPWYRGTVKLVKGKPVWTGQVNRAADHKFNEPLGWRAPHLVFVNSMSDFMLRTGEDRRDAIEIMRRRPQHRFQILTKRAELLHRLPPLPSNVWLGVSIERQDFAWRLDHLRAVDVGVRWISAEPLLGQLDLDLTGIGWLVTGGESGPGGPGRPLCAAPADPSVGRPEWLAEGCTALGRLGAARSAVLEAGERSLFRRSA